MNFLTHRAGLRIVFLSTTSLMCVLLASVMTRIGSSNGLFWKKPSVVLQASKTLITHPCPPDGYSISRSCPINDVDLNVTLTSIANDFNKQPLYVYTVNGGRVVGDGSKVTWELSGVWPGIYTATVEVRDSKRHRALSSATVKVVNCLDCVFIDFPCPTIAVTCYDVVKEETPITCKVVLGPATRQTLNTYEWSARGSNGEDLSGRISGRGTSISISTKGLAGQTVYTTVDVKGLHSSCSPTASSSTVVKP